MNETSVYPLLTYLLTVIYLYIINIYISQYNYRLEDRGLHGLDKMTKKEEEQCMEQLRKQADRIAKMFGFDKHWIT